MMIFCVLFLRILTMQSDPIAEWIHFEHAVRDQVIRKEDAKKEFPTLYQALENICRKYPFQPAASWRFPVQGYGVRDMGARGFRPDIRYGSSPVKGYDFYDGNRHGGHPAYDIFVRDSDQDSLDDRTHKPVNVLAPVDLMILSAESDWKPDSGIRGGRYIWAMNPLRDRIFYFAHLNEVRVAAGAFCQAGTVIGTVGRTGTNALPRRSPTHLHFMVLEVREGSLIPLDYRVYLEEAGRS